MTSNTQHSNLTSIPEILKTFNSPDYKYTYEDSVETVNVINEYLTDQLNENGFISTDDIEILQIQTQCLINIRDKIE